MSAPRRVRGGRPHKGIAWVAGPPASSRRGCSSPTHGRAHPWTRRSHQVGGLVPHRSLTSGAVRAVHDRPPLAPRCKTITSRCCTIGQHPGADSPSWGPEPSWRRSCPSRRKVGPKAAMTASSSKLSRAAAKVRSAHCPRHAPWPYPEEDRSPNALLVDGRLTPSAPTSQGTDESRSGHPAAPVLGSQIPVETRDATTEE